MAVITNTTRGVVLADHAEVADGLLARLTGLLVRQALHDGEALVIPRCSSIHTWWMRFPIDVLFIRVQGARCKVQGKNHEPSTVNLEREVRNGVVVKIAQDLKPFRLAWSRGADMVIELPVNTISRTSTALGERIAINVSDASDIDGKSA